MIFYITTHSKNIKYAEAIKEMFKGTDYKFYFVYGNNQQNKVEPYIEVDCEELYENLPLKTFRIFEHFLNSSYDKMIKMDDNVFLDFKKFHPEDYNQDYVGMFISCNQDIRSKVHHYYKVSSEDYKIPMKTFDLEYAQGSCYILSRKATRVCIDHGIEFFKNTPETYLGEDIRVGLCLSLAEITKLNLFEYNKILYETAKDLMIIHPIHFLVYPKLFQSKSNQETLNILSSLNFLNENLKRNIYLDSVIDV